MYGIEHKLLAIFYSLLMLVVACGVRAVAGTFLVPAGIFALAWFGFTFVPLVALFDVPINSWAILFILAAVIAFALSSLPFPWRKAREINLRKSLETARFDSPFLKAVLYASAGLSVMFSVATMVANGWTLQANLIELLATSGEFARQKASGEGVEYGVVGLLGVFFTYLCPVLGGLRSRAARPRWFFFVSVTPSLFTMITQSSKLVFLVAVCLYLASALVARIYANRLQLPRLSKLRKHLFTGLLLVALVLLSFTSRQGIFKLDMSAMIEPMMYMLSSYILGQIYAFSDFFSYSIGMPSIAIFKEDYYSLGAYSFASLFDMLGMGKEFPPGMYDESGAFTGVFETNIFTFFRGLIYDFGVFGSLLFLFVFGLLTHAVTVRVFTRGRAWFAIAVFISLMVFILMGYLFSVFVARYMYLNAIGVWALLEINQVMRGRRRAPAAAPA